ncbi:DUF2769 domain-containing protein [Methanosarcina acetivorans]|uniref:DUF2769 domain-containing protein n=1 Tax=Methanosarcina acetivorans (strain ATCC 35395 / DSM 2834 / JCM 12185 / C2A) TaxID=188937 RepID=Q8TL07_METAC|nr:DUF2769 domain-containing protein [Methanosarcina acetivorans]AAM06607.1 conserved hypothetical protein [Methanosarcina acetivorans C2A]
MGRDTPTEEKSSMAPKGGNITFEKCTDFAVPYVWENISRCRCPECPVQADSRCAQDKIKSSRKAMEYMPAGDVPYPEYIPGVFCSEGKSLCKDLNFDRQYICDSCDVWKEYGLKDADPNNHFCQQGRST